MSNNRIENILSGWKINSIRFYYWKNGGCYIMKLCKANYEETKSVMVESITKFIDYINEYCSEYAWLNDNMEKYAEESKGCVEEFIAEHNIDMEEWMKQKKYYDYKHIATDILDHIDEIHQKIIEVFIEPEMKYPAKVLEWMYDFRFFCYGDDTKGEFLSLTDQNDRLEEFFDGLNRK